jgi:hypothetical protein
VTDDRRKNRQRRWPFVQAIFPLALTLALGACRDAPDEPPAPPQTTAPPSPTLRWTVPPTWTLDKSAESGENRAKYKIPPQGEAKHDAELLVRRIGPGTQAKIDEQLDLFLKDFEGPGVSSARRETVTSGAITSHVLELEATYKFPMGPRVKGRPAATMIKEGWAGIAAGVMTPDSGNWMFTLVGPEDAVRAARSDLRNLLASLE